MVGPRLTSATLRLLREMVQEPQREFYGLELLDRTGLASGTLYPALARLRDYGWLESVEEQVDPRQAKRPARVYYRLTEDGLVASQSALQAVTPRDSGPRVSWRIS